MEAAFTPGQPTSRSGKRWGPDPTGAVREDLENCANVGSSLGRGVTGPPEKTLWACYRGRKTGTGTGQAEEEKPRGKVAFPPSHLSSLLLVTRRKATLLLILFQELIPGKTATWPQMA